MVVVQPRQHHLALQVDHLGVGGAERLGPLPVAHIEELAAAHHHGLCHLALTILSVDLAVEIKSACGGGRQRLLTARQRGGQQRGEQQKSAGTGGVWCLAIHAVISLRVGLSAVFTAHFEISLWLLGQEMPAIAANI